jgi:hypothetical protein
MSDISIKLVQLLRDKLSEPVYFRASQSPDGEIRIEQMRFLGIEGQSRGLVINSRLRLRKLRSPVKFIKASMTLVLQDKL